MIFVPLFKKIKLQNQTAFCLYFLFYFKDAAQNKNTETDMESIQKSAILVLKNFLFGHCRFQNGSQNSYAVVHIKCSFKPQTLQYEGDNIIPLGPTPTIFFSENLGFNCL
jgi:hypothetical protein